MSRTRFALVVAVALAGAALPGATRAGVAVDRIPVSFTVVNRGLEPPHPSCVADGATYTVRGTITGPAAVLHGAGVRTISLLMSGMDTGREWGWTLDGAFEGYDTPLELARLGHVTLSYDMLGYGGSGRPHGLQLCFASQAEVTHQIVSALRAGSYEGAAIAFDRVVLVAHDVAAPAAEIEAYTHKDIDGLVTMIWADQGFTPYIVALAGQRIAQCSAGGDDPAGRPLDGYLVFGPPDDQFREDLFHDMDPAVQDAFLARRDRNPCGYLMPILPSRSVETARLAEIAVPVLLIYPATDPVISRQGQEQQAAHYSGSDDVTTIFPDTGHFLMFERDAPQFRATLSDWLHTRFG